MNSKHYEESDYGLDLDFLTISYKSRVSRPRRGGLVAISNLSTLHSLGVPLLSHKVKGTHSFDLGV